MSMAAAVCYTRASWFLSSFEKAGLDTRHPPCSVLQCYSPFSLKLTFIKLRCTKDIQDPLPFQRCLGIAGSYVCLVCFALTIVKLFQCSDGSLIFEGPFRLPGVSRFWREQNLIVPKCLESLIEIISRIAIVPFCSNVFSLDFYSAYRNRFHSARFKIGRPVCLFKRPLLFLHGLRDVSQIWEWIIMKGKCSRRSLVGFNA